MSVSTSLSHFDADANQWHYATTDEWWSVIPCPTCQAPVGEVCRTRGAGTPSFTPHSARMCDEARMHPINVAKREAAAVAALARANSFAVRARNRSMHLKDQTVGGPYRAQHDAQRGEYRVIGRKLRTDGTVTIAVFKYRASNEMYFPMYEQAGVYADILVSRLNELNVTVKDPRQ
jgi:hypothetical protein